MNASIPWGQLGIVLAVALLAGLAASVLIGGFTTFAVDCREVREDVLRLHILANSDSDADQALKLKVRDRILRETGVAFEKPTSQEEAKAAAGELLETIEAVAADEIRQNGFAYPVRAELTRMYFTTREYEQFTLPAGVYDAVRVTIGEAAGHNWWCVLYPALCLPAADASAALADGFDEAETELVSRSPRYEIRFAVVEWYEAIRQYFGF